MGTSKEEENTGIADVVQPSRHSGRLQVGGELGISEITVKAHRGKVMRKMKAASLAELVTMAAKLRIARKPDE